MPKWMGWPKGPGENGHIKDRGESQEWAGKPVQGRQKTVTDEPFVKAKHIIRGSLWLRPGDLEQAVELFKRCPIFQA